MSRKFRVCAATTSGSSRDESDGVNCVTDATQNTRVITEKRRALVPNHGPIQSLTTADRREAGVSFLDSFLLAATFRANVVSLDGKLSCSGNVEIFASDFT
jgi:hypothetical protein